MTNAPTLSSPARKLILDLRDTVQGGLVSIREIAIQHSLGCGSMPISGADTLAYCREAGNRVLEIISERAAEIERLRYFNSDPFSRLLISRALSDPRKLITLDVVVARYHPELLLF